MINNTKIKIAKKYEDRIDLLDEVDGSYLLRFAPDWESSWHEQSVCCNCIADVQAFVHMAIQK